jgi:hypothetical protein
MWGEAGDSESVAKDVAKGVADVNYLSNTGGKMSISDACALKYKQDFGDAIPVTSQEEANKEPRKTAVISSNYRSLIVRSRSYIAAKPMPTKLEQLEEYFSRNKQYMRRKAIVEMKQLLSDWRE